MNESAKLFNENSHLNEEGIALYVDAILLGKNYQLPGALILHVADCVQCKKEVIETYMLVESQEYDAKDGHPYFLDNVINREKTFLVWYRFAAVIVVTISVGVILYLFLSINQRKELTGKLQTGRSIVANNEQSATAAGDTIQSPSVLNTENFLPSSNLENLVNAQLRSPALRVISPEIDALVDQHVKFEWEGDGDDAVKIEILSNKDRVLQTVNVPGSSCVLNLQFAPGIYYWKLEGKNELLYVGKFIVKRGN